MPSVSFDVANSFYNFVCFLGIFVILMPQVFIYFLSDESMLDTYKMLNNNFGVPFWVSLIVVKIIGIIVLIIGMYKWYKKSQYYLDLKQERETLKMIAASEEEIREKENQKRIHANYNNGNNLNKEIEFSTIKYPDNPKIYEDAFYNYITNKYHNEYEIYRNVRFNFIYGGKDSYICDIVLKAKNKEKYILYEVKGRYFSPIHVGNVKNYFMSLLHSNLFYKCKGSRAIIVFIVANEKEKENINKYYMANEKYFKDEEVTVEIKVYLIDEIKV